MIVAGKLLLDLSDLRPSGDEWYVEHAYDYGDALKDVQLVEVIETVVGHMEECLVPKETHQSWGEISTSIDETSAESEYSRFDMRRSYFCDQDIGCQHLQGPREWEYGRASEEYEYKGGNSERLIPLLGKSDIEEIGDEV